jgi:hypothetical protein
MSLESQKSEQEMTTLGKKIKLPKGISDFVKIRSEGYYYVDKSKFVVDFMNSPAESLLFPRPRRFGKTLNMTTLKAWFEGISPNSTDAQKAAHSKRSQTLFAELAADQLAGEHHKLRANTPVIFLTFKDVKETTWSGALLKISQLVSAEVRRLRSWWEHEQKDHQLLIRLESLAAESLTGEARTSLLANALLLLSQALCLASGEKVLILIDEYDTPIQQAFVKGHLSEAVAFFRNFLSAGLKDNSYLFKGALTGILRVSKENLFSGLNNLDVFSILRDRFSEYFGLTEHEVAQMMLTIDAEDKMPEMRTWYNGYFFGNTTVYNPWSVISFADDIGAGLQPFWVNTADSSLVGQVISRGGASLREELFTLLAGGSVEKTIDENVTMSEHGVPEEKAWSFLLFTGYLKQSDYKRVGMEWTAKLTIPNFEVSIAFYSLVREWLAQRMQGSNRLNQLTHALTTGDAPTFFELFQEFVLNCLSVHDVAAPRAEQVYHSFTIGLLTALYSTHQVKSNLESGLGRPGLLIIPHDKTKLGIVIEFKKVGKGQTAEQVLDLAEKQIVEKKYVALIHDSGCSGALALAIAFEGKEVFLRVVLKRGE